MLIILLSLLSLIPALALLIIGIWVTHQEENQQHMRRWLLVLFGASIILLLPFAAFARSIRTGSWEVALLLVLPSLVAVLALLILLWREILAQWQVERGLFTALLAAVLVLIGLITLGDAYIALLFSFLPVLLAGIWALLGRLKVGALLAFSALVAVYLWLEAFGAVENPQVYLDESRAIYPLLNVLALLLGLSLSAMLVVNGAKLRVSGGRGKTTVHFVLAGLTLLGLAATVYRQGMLVRATMRAAEDHLPVGAIFGGLVIGLLVTGLNLKDERRIAGLSYTVLVPIIMVAAFALGLQQQPLLLTETRAERIAQAVERYHQERGQYPSQLGDLTPSYMTYILGPFTGRGQRWCYQGGEDFYRLGYVVYLRYPGMGFDPLSEIRIPAARGVPPSPAWMCDAELERIRLTGGL